MFDKILIAIENALGLHKQCFTHAGLNVVKNQSSPGYETTPLVAAPVALLTTDPNYTIEGDSEYNTPEEQARIPQIQAALNAYIKANQYHDYMVDVHNGLDLNQTEGLTAEQVVQKTLSSTAHIVIRFYYDRWTTTIGYRNPGENVVYCNRKYHDGYSITDEMSNILHEFLHIIDVTAPLCGWQHDFEATARRPFSVNYMANAAVEATEPNQS